MFNINNIVIEQCKIHIINRNNDIIRLAVQRHLIFLDVADLGDENTCYLLLQNIINRLLKFHIYRQVNIISHTGIYSVGNLYNLIPYIVTMVVLVLTSKKSRAPKAEGIPYDKGQR